MSLPAEFDYLSWWREKLQGVPCEAATADEVAQIAADQDVALPKAYESFLLTAGRRCGHLWIGSHAFFFPSLVGLRTAATELLEEFDTGFALGSADVVIGMHEGYDFLFLSGVEANPAVFRFTEGHSGPTQVADRFSELVLSALATDCGCYASSRMGVLEVASRIWEEEGWARPLWPYLILFHALLERALPPVAFEALFLSQYKNDPERWSPLCSMCSKLYSVSWTSTSKTKTSALRLAGLMPMNSAQPSKRALELLADLEQQGDPLHG